MPHLIHSLTHFPPDSRCGAVAIGNFDGVHRGHANLIAELVSAARKVNGPAIVFTFDPPPIALLQPDRILSAPLTSIQRRAELLHRLGVDLVIAYPTDMALLQLSAEEFFQKVLLDALAARAIVEGPNFRFGKDRLGDIQRLAELCSRNQIALTVVEAANDSCGMISSTRIRQLITQGDMAEANALLTEPYQLMGSVGHGAARGRTIGTPTANLTQVQQLVPPHGVYAGCVPVGDSLCAAAIHIGPNPTFGDSACKIEVHLIDWRGELYDSEVRCTFLDRLRDIKKFDSPAELQAQIAKDIDRCRAIFDNYSNASR